VLDEASKDEVMTGSTSGVNFDSIKCQKAVMQALSIIDRSAEPRLPVLVKVKNILANVPATLAWRSMLFFAKLTWYMDVKLR